MVALVSGNSLGLNLTSLATLGARGVAGSAAVGRGTDRVYVNVSNGNLVMQNRDDGLAGPGLWIDSLRTYNSQEHLGGNHRLPGLQPPALTSTGGIGKPNSRIVRKDADGGEDLYSYDFNRDAYLSTDGGGAYDTIRYVNSQMVWTDGDTGLTEYYARYQNEWQLVVRQDSNGNAIAFSYNKDGQVLSAINRNGEGVYYDYGNRLLMQVRTVTIDANGNAQTVRVRYGYDSFNRLASVSVDLSPEDGGTGDGRVYVTRYEYDGPSDRLTAVRESDGSLLAIAYVGAGNDIRVASVTNALGETLRFAYANGSTTVTDALGLVTRYDYDALGQLLRITGPAIAGGALVQGFTYNARGDVVQVTDPNGTTTRYVYDNLGRRTSETVDPDGLALTTRYTYDANGNVVAKTDANGHVSRYAYDAENRLVASVDPAGGVTTMTYDANGRIAKSVAYAQPIGLDDLPGIVTGTQIASRIQAGANDQTSTRLYDHDGRLTATVDGIGAVVRYTYDGNGNVVERRAYARPIDLADWQPGTLPSTQADDAHDLRLRTRYDAANRAIATVDGVGALTVQRYDANGNLLARIAYATPVDPDLALTSPALADAASGIAHAAADRNDSYRYDAANRVALHVDGMGAVTCYRYDANGNLLRSIAHASALQPGQDPGQVASSAADRITDGAYDAANRLLWQIDALGGVTQWRHDANGHVLSATRYAQPIAAPTAQSAPLAAGALQALIQAQATLDRTSRYAWDAAGRQTWSIDAEGAVTAIRYDGLGQPLATTRHAQALDAAALTQIDAATQPVARSAAIASLAHADAAQDRTDRRYYDAAQRLVASIDAQGYVSLNGYDALGRLVRQESLARALDIGALPATFDALQGALIRDPALDHVDAYDMDAAGRTVAHTDALGNTESWTFDALGNKTRYRNALGATWTYDHDAAGRTTRETSPQVLLAALRVAVDGSLAPDAAQSGYAAVVTALRYDALGNLIARTEAQGRPEARTTFYAYDALGRQVRSDFPPVGVYDAALDDLANNGRVGLAARTERIDALYSETHYDTLGNAIAGRDVGGSSSYKTYDRLGRLEFEIDALGNVTGYARNTSRRGAGSR